MKIKKLIKKLIDSRKEVILQLHTDIMFYQNKLDILGDDDNLRAERKKLVKSLELDKEGKIRKLEKNEKIKAEIGKIDSHLDEMDRTIEQLNVQKLKLKDFEIYLDMLIKMDKFDLVALEDAINKFDS